MTPEGRVKAAVAKWLVAQSLLPAAKVQQAAALGQLHDGWFFMPVASRFSVKGVPDFMGVWRGVCFGIEAKAPRGMATEHQTHQMAAISAAGGLTLVVDDVSQLDLFKSLMEGRWKNDTWKARKNSNACSGPTQSARFPNALAQNKMPALTAQIASYAASPFRKAGSRSAGAGATTVNQ